MRALSGNGMCHSQREEEWGSGGGEFPEIVLHIHLHILSGLDMCIGLLYEAFNMYILFINLENY